MADRLTRELLIQVAQAAINRERMVFLCQNLDQADRLADRFRKALIDEAVEQGVGDVTARTKLFRPAGANPSLRSDGERRLGVLLPGQ